MTPRTADFSRQSFLGANSQHIIERARLAIVGLGGGGSHAAQQSAHIGFMDYALCDAQRIDATNLNRLVGETQAAVEAETTKVEIAKSLIQSIRPAVRVQAIPRRCQEEPEPLKTADVIIGCVDTFAERRELEILSRRYLIPYVDIGMDVHTLDGQPPRMAGQIVLSMPGAPCLSCFDVLNDENLRKEAERYGNVGPRPQVIWPNGVLASTAVGIVVDLLTDWTRALRTPPFLSYDGNTGTLTPHVRLKYLDTCSHYPSDLGDPKLKPL
jgi:molybdopterin-synthase adenylyltransferase